MHLTSTHGYICKLVSLHESHRWSFIWWKVSGSHKLCICCSKCVFLQVPCMSYLWRYNSWLLQQYCLPRRKQLLRWLGAMREKYWNNEISQDDQGLFKKQKICSFLICTTSIVILSVCFLHIPCLQPPVATWQMINYLAEWLNRTDIKMSTELSQVNYCNF